MMGDIQRFLSLPEGTIGSSGEGSVESGRRRIAARLGEAGGCGVGRRRERRSPPAPRPRSRPADETSGCAGASSADSDSPPTRGADRRGGARAPRWPAVPRARRRLRRVTHSSRRSSDTGNTLVHIVIHNVAVEGTDPQFEMKHYLHRSIPRCTYSIITSLLWKILVVPIN